MTMIQYLLSCHETYESSHREEDGDDEIDDVEDSSHNDDDDDDDDVDDNIVGIPRHFGLINFGLQGQASRFIDIRTPHGFGGRGVVATGSVLRFPYAWSGGEDDEEEDEPPCNCRRCTSLTCPICSAVHERDSRRQGNYSPPPEHSCSHGAILLFVPADCPVCMEERVDPPVVALPCGHVLCCQDFKTMRGVIGVEAEDDKQKAEVACHRDCHSDTDDVAFHSFMHQLLAVNLGAPSDDDDDDDSENSGSDYDDLPPHLQRNDNGEEEIWEEVD